MELMLRSLPLEAQAFEGRQVVAKPTDSPAIHRWCFRVMCGRHNWSVGRKELRQCLDHRVQTYGEEYTLARDMESTRHE